MCQWTLNIPRG